MEKATSDHGEIASLLSKLAFGVDKGENEEFLDHWLEDARLIYVDVDGARFECANSREILQLIKLVPAAGQPSLHAHRHRADHRCRRRRGARALPHGPHGARAAGASLRGWRIRGDRPTRR